MYAIDLGFGIEATVSVVDSDGNQVGSFVAHMSDGSLKGQLPYVEKVTTAEGFWFSFEFTSGDFSSTPGTITASFNLS